jgi:SpoVK/Ycf46/Vps4 family AAA+-type ATPase
LQKDRPIVCLFEDIDAIVNKYGEDELLSLLDGETQIDRVLNIATTNYPEKIDKRIVARPRRFDRRIKIGMPSEKVRQVYFQKKLKIDKSEIDKWVESTDSFSFASCAELVISVKCLGITFDEAVEILRKLMDNKDSSDDDREMMGFKTDKPGLAGLIKNYKS